MFWKEKMKNEEQSPIICDHLETYIFLHIHDIALQNINNEYNKRKSASASGESDK